MKAKAAKKSSSGHTTSKKKSRRRAVGAWRRPLLISVIIGIVATVATLVWFPNLILAPIVLICILGAWVLSTIL